MNDQRTNFVYPHNFHVNITPYWLLGFIEGDGHFGLRAKEHIHYFSLEQTHLQRYTLNRVKLYFEGLDSNLLYDSRF